MICFYEYVMRFVGRRGVVEAMEMHGGGGMVEVE